ncbi:MAG: FAD-dependent oxidoreductase [Chloroflexi bacterium]|nr:FAD-dependent oxidoreductase [Chloroflexota bacterium]
MQDYKAEYDVIVVGGGTGGVPAAIAAARNGASVLLIEKNGFLGGLTTGGLVRTQTYWVDRDLKEPYVKGIFAEVLERLRELEALDEDGRTWDEEVLKYVWEEMSLRAGVQLLFHSFVFQVEKDGRHLTSVHVANKSGVTPISGKVFVDCTGDGDLVALAGAKWVKGRETDGATQAMSMIFRVGGVDMDKLPSASPNSWIQSARSKDPSLKEPYDMPHDIANMHREYLKAKERGEITSPRPALFWWRHSRPGIVHFDHTWVINLDATKAEDLTRAEIEGKRQVIELLNFLKRFPAFKNAYLIQMGSEIGVREARRIVGEYVLTKDDVLSCRKFDDGIAEGAGPINIKPVNEAMAETTIIHSREHATYEIPYRCLLPQDIDNLLIGSRCLSVTHEALGSVRHEPIIFGVGQAAGTAASLSSRLGVIPRNLDVKLLQKTLLDQRVLLFLEDEKDRENKIRAGLITG